MTCTPPPQAMQLSNVVCMIEAVHNMYSTTPLQISYSSFKKFFSVNLCKAFMQVAEIKKMKKKQSHQANKSRFYLHVNTVTNT